MKVSLPSLLSGLKVAATYSVSGAVVGEWIASQEGLGYYLLRVKNNYMLDKVFACVVVIILLSLLPWKMSGSGSADSRGLRLPRD